MQKQFQQGDCLIIQAESIPAGARAVKASPRGYVLAEGEVTNHAHVIEECPEVEMFESEGTFYLSVKRSVQVLHEEHKPQTLTPGNYRIGRVVEVDPFTEEVRKVMD